MGDRKTTRAFIKGRAEFKTQCKADNAPCWICGIGHIDYDAPHDDYTNDDRFQLDHLTCVHTPQLQRDPSNWRNSAAGCNRERGNGDTRPPLGILSRTWS